jgi:hypothetical protein
MEETTAKTATSIVPKQETPTKEGIDAAEDVVAAVVASEVANVAPESKSSVASAQEQEIVQTPAAEEKPVEKKSTPQAKDIPATVPATNDAMMHQIIRMLETTRIEAEASKQQILDRVAILEAKVAQKET